jgi:hypothetical protein
MAALARILGPVVGLVLNDKGILYPYWAAAALMGVSILLTALLRRPADAAGETRA